MVDIDDNPGETTPLVATTNSNNDDDATAPALKDMKEQTLKEKVVGVGAVIGLTSSIAAMAVESHPIVYISGALGAIVAPLTFLQQTKLTQVEALSQVNEKMDVEVNTLKQENSRLANQVTTLESSVVHLQEMSQTLETIRAVEGQSIDTLEQQLKDSETILGTMQDNLRGNIIQTIITFVFAINRDGDMFLSDDEIGTLIIKIEEMAGGQFDLKDDLLRQKLCENGRSLTAILDLVRNLLDEDTPPEESIFAFIH